MSETMEKPKVDASPHDKWVSHFLGIEVARLLGTASDDAAEGDQPEEALLGLDEGELRGRLNEIGIRLRNRSDADALGDIRDLFKQAVEALKGRDLVSCDELLTEVADALDAIPDAGRAKKEIGGGGPSLRVIATLGLTWQKKCEAQAAELTELIGQLADDVVDSGVCESPEEEAEVTKNVNKLLDSAEMIRGFSTELQELLDRDTLDELVNATPPQRKELLVPVLSQLDIMESQIKADELLGFVKENHIKPIDPQAALVGLIGEFRKQVAA
ncbi:MAG TPA: hypothetical protein VKS60_05795 [Stellaceae bacterium]|nr:hypothetical protein [Stellaceae bacterium]